MADPAGESGVKKEIESPSKMAAGGSIAAAVDPPCETVKEWIAKRQTSKLSACPEPGDFRDVLQTDMEDIFKKYGGPCQFLEAALTSPEEASSFARWLDELHPGGAEVWDRQKKLPIGETFKARVADMSFKSCASVKPPTFQKVALSLVDEFAMNGFFGFVFLGMQCNQFVYAGLAAWLAGWLAGGW